MWVPTVYGSSSVPFILLFVQCIPQVNFSDLEHLTSEQIDNIRRKGSVVVRGVVDIEEAVQWKLDLQEFLNNNPHVEGM